MLSLRPLRIILRFGLLSWVILCQARKAALNPLAILREFCRRLNTFRRCSLLPCVVLQGIGHVWLTSGRWAVAWLLLHPFLARPLSRGCVMLS